MFYQDLIREKRPRMSKSFVKLADFLLNHYVRASFMTATELAHELNLDAATVVRFAQNLGYNGYPELLRDVRSHVKRDLFIRHIERIEPDSIENVINHSFSDLAIVLEQTRISIDPLTLSNLVEKIGDASHIAILAAGPGHQSAASLAAFLEIGNFPVSISLTESQGFAVHVNNSKAGDLILAIDVADDYRYIAASLYQARKKGVTTAVISGSPTLPSCREADLVLAARTSDSLHLSQAAIDSIIFTLIRALEWSHEDRYKGVDLAINELSKQLQDYEL